jgi:acyl-CoA synthetase (AMP-forming)/AMP-acid ligase II
VVTAAIASAPDRTVPRVLRASADQYGDRVAISDGALRVTFRELHEQALEAARAFAAHGVLPGDRVGLWAPNSARWALSALGILAAGGVIVPINTRYRGAEAREFLSRTEARVLVVERGFLGYDHVAAIRHRLEGEADGDGPELDLVIDVSADARGDADTVAWSDFLGAAGRVDAADAARTAEAVSPDDLSEIIFTSGTTGRAKGVTLRHGAAVDLYREYGVIWGLQPGDRYLISLPFFHTGGLKAGLLCCLLFGVTMVPMPVFDPALALQLIERERISVMNGSPTIYSSILDHPDRDSYDVSTLRIAATGAAIVPQRLVERARSELPFRNFITAYGLTECCGTATMCRDTDSTETVAATNGSALPGVELRVTDPFGVDVPVGEPGEVLVRGGNVTLEYWRDPEATRAAIDPDGWLHTGDIGTLDANGNLKITDRLKDLFIVGGFNVSPAEVEQVMARHPDVSEVAVIGVPDQRLGEVAKAYVLPKHGRQPVESEMIAWCRERLANFKVPRSIELVTALPRNASGKVLKRELRAAQAVPKASPCR